jgi:hypothetical protein
MDTAEKVLREVEQSAKKISQERQTMKPKRELLRLLDKSGALTAKQRERMTTALGETPGRKAEKPGSVKQARKQSAKKLGPFEEREAAKRRQVNDAYAASQKKKVVAALEDREKLDVSHPARAI